MEFGPCTKPEEFCETLDRATATMAAASAEALQTVVLFDERKLWQRDGATSMSSWLAARYGLAWGTAREWVRVAHALQALPEIARGYAEAKLSWDQLRAVTRFALPIPTSIGLEGRPNSVPPRFIRRPLATNAQG